MKNIKIVSICFVVLSLSAQLCGAASEKPISLQIENLSRWKNASEASAIRKSLHAVLKPHPDHPQSAKLLKILKMNSSLIERPFLLLDVESNDFGGFFGLVVFKNHPHLLRLWVYEIDKNVFEVRDIEQLSVKLSKTIMDELKDSRITPFWLTPSS